MRTALNTTINTDYIKKIMYWLQLINLSDTLRLSRKYSKYVHIHITVQQVLQVLKIK